MKQFKYEGFYGDHGRITVHNDNTATLEMICAGKKTRKKYKSLRGAKSALSKYSDAYTLTEIAK